MINNFLVVNIKINIFLTLLNNLSHYSLFIFFFNFSKTFFTLGTHTRIIHYFLESTLVRLIRKL